jgi:hypothetical protein
MNWRKESGLIKLASTRAGAAAVCMLVGLIIAKIFHHTQNKKSKPFNRQRRKRMIGDVPSSTKDFGGPMYRQAAQRIN